MSRLRVLVRLPRPVLLTALPLLGVLAFGGLANAVWTGVGGGIGSGTTATTQPITLNPATPVAGLFPGGSGDVTVTASNPNPASAVITSLTLEVARPGGAFAVDAGHPGCTTSALSYATQTNSGAGWTVPARSGGSDGTLSITLSNALTMTVAAPNACQGATVTVYLAAGS